MTKPRIVSGIKPSGKLHLGNYLGMIKNAIALQNSGEYECFYFIADLHSLTETFKPEEKRGQIWDVAMDLLALGFDPEKSALFIQSQIPEHLELAWIFNCLTPVSELERMTQYKDFLARGHAANAGLFTYPVLQAADILLYHAQFVPVGEDQLQHLELTNEIAKKFNNRFGQTFAPIKPLLTQTPRVMSLLDPTKKMSKSLGESHVLNLSDEPEIIEKKLARAVTDTGKEKKMSPGVKNLFMLLEIFGEPQQVQYFREVHKSGTIRYTDLKAGLAKVIAHHFAEYRQKRKELEKTPEYLDQVIKQGQQQAQIIAQATLKTVRQNIGLI